MESALSAAAQAVIAALKAALATLPADTPVYEAAEWWVDAADMAYGDFGYADNLYEEVIHAQFINDCAWQFEEQSGVRLPAEPCAALSDAIYAAARSIK